MVARLFHKKRRSFNFRRQQRKSPASSQRRFHQVKRETGTSDIPVTPASVVTRPVAIPSGRRMATNQAPVSAPVERFYPAQKDQRQNQPAKPEIRRDAPDATLVIIYQDEHQKSMAAPQVIHGRLGAPLQLQFREFAGYNLIHITGFVSSFVDPYGTMTLTYRRQNGGQVWMFCRDIDELNLLAYPRFINGKLHAQYNLSSPFIDHYNLIRADGPARGQFTEEQQTVTYLYRRADWQTVDYDPRDLQMDAFVPCYDGPAGEPVGITLVKGTIWHVYETVTLTNHQVWCCMGGNIWIEQTDEQVTPVDRPAMPAWLRPNRTTENTFTNQYRDYARIDFVPGKKAALYDQPFGHRIDGIIHGTPVIITGSVRTENMIWYQVDDRGWIPRQYTKALHNLSAEEKQAIEQQK